MIKTTKIADAWAADHVMTRVFIFFYLPAIIKPTKSCFPGSEAPVDGCDEGRPGDRDQITSDYVCRIVYTEINAGNADRQDQCRRADPNQPSDTASQVGAAERGQQAIAAERE